MKSMLYNLSKFANAYCKQPGSPAYGFCLTAYRGKGKDAEYKHIWLPAETVVSKHKLPNGHIAVTIEFCEIKVKSPKPKNPDVNNSDCGF